MSINLVSCLICTFWHWKFYFIPFFKSKQLPSPGYFRKLEILEVEAQIKHAGRVIPKALLCIWMEHNWSSFASSLPPIKREGGWCYGSWSEIHVLPTVLLLSPLWQLMPASHNFQNIHPCFFFLKPNSKESYFFRKTFLRNFTYTVPVKGPSLYTLLLLFNKNVWH